MDDPMTKYRKILKYLQICTKLSCYFLIVLYYFLQNIQFDETLSEIFELYASLRRACSIDAMQVIQLDEDAFDSLRVSSSSPQRKLPRVIRDTVKIQELLLHSLKPW